MPTGTSRKVGRKPATAPSPQVRQMIDEYINGAPDSAIAGRHGLKTVTVGNHLRRWMTSEQRRLGREQQQAIRDKARQAKLGRVRPQVMLMLQAGCRSNEICRKLGLSREELTSLLSELGEGVRKEWKSVQMRSITDRRYSHRRLPRRSPPREPAFSEDDCCMAVSRVAAQCDGQLFSMVTYDRLRDSTDPAAITLKVRYDGWVAALKQLLPELFDW